MVFYEALGHHLGVAIRNARLFEQVQAGRRRLSTLSQRLIQAQEAERRDLARELHDEIGQALTAVKINLQTAQRTQDAASQTARLEDCLQIVDQALQQVRDLSLNLRPSLLDDLGLAAALRWYSDRLAQRAGIAANFTVDLPERSVPTEIATTCFRIAQEALTNSIRHAHARQIRVRLQHQDRELRLSVEDNGRGFDVAAARESATRGESVGLLGMEERALLVGGEVEIESVPGKGTTVSARLPLKSPLGNLERRKKKRG
jgi:signal transduction histidine kinase